MVANNCGFMTRVSFEGIHLFYLLFDSLLMHLKFVFISAVLPSKVPARLLNSFPDQNTRGKNFSGHKVLRSNYGDPEWTK